MRALLPCALSGLLLLSCSAQASPAPTHDFELDNGLRVIVREDHRAPVVSTHMVVKVGSSHEHPGQSGLSHALEHLVFTGSGKTSAGEYSQILERLGAEENAYTSRDLTVFHQTLSAPYLGLGLELLADLLVAARLDAAQFDVELPAIKAERRQRLDSAHSRLGEQLQAIAHSSSSYATPVIGWPSDLERMNAAELTAWYRAWYAPNNSVLVVVGAVTGEQVRSLAQRHFGGLPRTPLAAVKAPLDYPVALRQVTLRDGAATPAVAMAFNVPSHATATAPRDVNALRLTQALLGGGLSARLVAGPMREQERLMDPFVSYSPFTRGDSLFVVQASINPTKALPLDNVRSALQDELQALKAAPPTPQALERARTWLLAQLVYARDDLSAQADELSALSAAGLPLSLLASEREDLQAITAQDIQHVARTYFSDERLSVAYIKAPEADDE
ncbi:M16 family metallopeptidase [Pseudomonas aegrilactucae]|uniref:Insulinase family protein n=1 Tax=Pseudomonas aegrilactucae TaxID=2854028 RepID=A0A9Q2XLZ2_9PSED|nr:pitrilysin family protein [Pseudomonas aegrilactucae]MBV6289123.1 insulinase family protein [Pseudomonas aegrilactucae]